VEQVVLSRESSAEAQLLPPSRYLPSLDIFCTSTCLLALPTIFDFGQPILTRSLNHLQEEFQGLL
jgi:hypothetical protein